MRSAYSLLTALSLFTLAGCQHPAPPADTIWFNVKQEQLDGVPHHNSFSLYRFRTASPAIKVWAHTTYQAPYLDQASFTVWANGHYLATLHPTGKEREEEFTIALPGAGEHEVTVQEGPQQRALEQGPLNFTTLTSIEPASGYTISWQKPVRQQSALFVFGDSRTQGGVNPEVGRTAWPVLLRQQLPVDVYVSGYSSLQLGMQLDKPAKRAALTSEVKRALQPYSTKCLWIEGGINDYETAHLKPEQLKDLYRQWLQELHAELPLLRIKLQTDIVKQREEKNKLGYSLPEYRQAEAAAGAGLPYVQVVDGLQLAEVRNLKDGVHLNVEGDRINAERVARIIQ